MIIEFLFDRKLAGHKEVFILLYLSRYYVCFANNKRVNNEFHNRTAGFIVVDSICVCALLPVKCQNETKDFSFGSKSIHVGEKKHTQRT